MKKARYGKTGIICALIATAMCCVALAFAWLYFNIVKPTTADFAEDNASVILERRELKINAASLSTVQSNWSQAVQESLNNGTQVTVKLSENWINKTLGTGVGFSEGRIHVPAGANIKLDLNGKKISRSLTAATANGNLILVEGTLEILDSSANKRGTLTGAYGEAGGAIVVNGGSLTITAGTIKENKTAKHGGGVYLDNGASMVMDGGEINENETIPSGEGVGVYVGTGCSFIMNGGEMHKNNSHANAGAVLLHSETSYFEMTGGVIAETIASSGAGVYIDAGLFKMTGGEIKNNTSANRGGGVVVGNAYGLGKFIMEGGVISGNSAVGYGGGVCVYKDAEFEMYGGEITGNTCQYGGGVFAEDGKFTMYGGKISENVSTYGGAVYSGGDEHNGLFHMIDGEICNNKRQGDGDFGIGVTSNALVIMDGGKIYGNVNSTRGGGVMVYGKFIMNGGEIYDNSATEGGGVCAGQAGIFEMNGGKIRNNTGTDGGGAVYLFHYDKEHAIFTMNGGEITENVSPTTSSGGAIYVDENCEFTMTDGLIARNKAPQNSGGAISVRHAKFTMTGGEISENSAHDGGAIYLNNYDGLTDTSKTTKVNITGGVIKNNTATSGHGGAVVVDGYTTLTISDCEITGNRANSSGGGVYVNANATFEMKSGLITGNNVSSSGGGVYLASGATFKLANGFIYGNTRYSSNSNLSFGGTSDVITVTGKFEREKTRIGLTRAVGNAFTSGYADKGNKVADGNIFFFHDAGQRISSNNANELIISSSSVQPASIRWSYTLNGADEKTIPNNEYNFKVPYTGGVYSLKGSYSVSGQSYPLTSFTVTDEDGNRVTAFNKVGKYYVLATDPSASNHFTNGVFTFEIMPADLGDAVVTAEKAVYNGGSLTPVVSVTLDGRKLKKGVDYTVTYENNVNAGNAAVAKITGIGNYTGTAEGNFTIEKANLGVRLGQTTVEYNGKPQNVQIYLEGLKGGDTVEANITYTLNGVAVSAPEAAGTYVATITIDADNYKFSSVQEYNFTVNCKKVNVTWEGTSFDYDGQVHAPTAYFVTVDGIKVPLTVNHPNATAAGTYQASVTALPQGYENYVITSNTTKEYKIVKSGLHATWGNDDFTYDGTAKELTATLTDGEGNDLTSYLTFEYFDKEGNAVTPVDAGEYTVKITLTHSDFVLGGDTEYKYVIKKATATVNVDSNFDGTYSGNGVTPVQSVTNDNGDDVQYKATYAKVDQYGNVIGEYGEALPVNVGRYSVKIEVLDGNYCVSGGEYFTEIYEVEVKEITVVWSGDDNSMLENGVYLWLYDGNKHAPTATAEDIELTVTGANSTVAGVLTATASLDNANYKLVGSLTASYQIIKSVVTGTVWYEYGSETPIDVDGGEVPEIPYISVYGKDGPKFSAYGALTAADPNVTWTATETSYIKLQVSYPEFEQGYWTVREQVYSASATLAGADKFNDSCSMPLSVAAQATFKVTDLSHDSEKAEIKWIVVGDNGEHLDAASYEFIYNGTAQAPRAIRIIDSDAYDATNPADGTYEFLTVSGGSVEAGTHYAYIIPEGNYAIEGSVSDFEYVIKPKQITVNWTVGTYVYDGVTAHKPVAVANGTDGIPCTVTVNGYVEAGTWTATAEVGKNFEITQNGTCEFTVERMTLSGVQWSFETGDEGTVRNHPDEGDYFVWAYDGNVHTPKASLKVTIDGADKEISVIVTGGMSEVGTHYAFAALDSADFANANFKLEVEKLRFDIVRDTVNIVWADEDTNGDIIYDYDGTEKKPVAYYVTAGGQQTPLNVVGSATDAGTYVAYITDKLDIANGATHEFTIKAKELSVTWSDLSKEYDGTEKKPTVTFTDPNAADPTAQVNLVLGVDYAVTGFVNAGSYTSVISFINKNYTVAAGTDESNFTVTKKDVTLTWLGNDDGTFEWKHDGQSHVPAVTPVSGLNITVIGEETDTGVYTATAIPDNDNYNVTNATQSFEIKPFEITVIWSGRTETQPDGSTVEKFEWEFDGEHEFKPVASYVDGEGNTVTLEVAGGKIYAGEYTASVILPENCAIASGETGTKDFKITKKIIHGIIWTGNKGVGDDGNEVETFEWTFNGKPQAPTAKIQSTGAALTVTGASVNAGNYTATAVLSDDKNYEFAADVVTTHAFSINPVKDVDVLWYGNGDTLGTNFNTYVYDGATIYCPVAKFVDVDGNEVEMPVNGGTASAGQWVATAIGDAFKNYEFRELKIKRIFEIVKADIAVTWETGYADVDGTYTYTYTYDGKAKLPEATNATNSLTFAYVIRNAEGNKIDAAVNVGEYTVEVVPNDGNFKIADHAIIKVVIEKKTLTVQWGNLSLLYSGEAQAPVAWYVDDDGHRIDLAVTGAATDAGTNHQATAELVSDGEKSNYILTNETVTFTIEQPVQVEYVWIWDDETSTGSWQIKTSGGSGDNTGSDDGNN